MPYLIEQCLIEVMVVSKEGISYETKSKCWLDIVKTIMYLESYWHRPQTRHEYSVQRRELAQEVVHQ